MLNHNCENETKDSQPDVVAWLRFDFQKGKNCRVKFSRRHRIGNAINSLLTVEIGLVCFVSVFVLFGYLKAAKTNEGTGQYFCEFKSTTDRGETRDYV